MMKKTSRVTSLLFSVLHISSRLATTFLCKLLLHSKLCFRATVRMPMYMYNVTV